MNAVSPVLLSSLGAVVLSFLAIPAAAQEPSPEQEPPPQSERGGIVVVGTIQDRLLQEGVPQALVEFFRPAPEDTAFTELAVRSVASVDGGFSTPGLAPGRYRVRVEALAYQTLEREVQVDGASPMQMAIHLAPEAVELEALVVVSRRSPRLESQGFYNRRVQGLGATFTREEIEATGYRRVTDIVRNTRGLTLRQVTPASNPHLFMRAGGSACRPDIILDGVNMGSNLSVDDVASATDLEALEVHRSTSIPPQFHQSHCGAVILWTRDPRMGGATRPLDMRRLGVAAGFVLATILFTR